MGFRGKRNRVMLCSIFIIAMFVIFNPNVNFQISAVHAGDWETVEYIDSIDDLQTEDPMVIEGELVSKQFIPAASETNYVDAVQSQTYGTTTGLPPNYMGADDDAESILTEESYVSISYSTVTSYTGGTLPAGWTNTDWSFVTNYARIIGFDQTGGNFYTAQHDMSSYVGVRVKFDWRNEGGQSTELGELTCNSYEGGNNVWFSSPAGHQGSYKNELRDSAWHSTLWKVTFTASGLTGDVESWEGFVVDNIYLQGKVENTYYRFEAVYRFDSVSYDLGTIERLYIDNDAATSTEALYWYGGITTDPTTFIGSTYADDANFDVHDVLTGTPFYVKVVDLTRSGDTDQDSWLIDRLYVYVENVAPVNVDAACTNLDDGDNLYARYKPYIFTSNVSDANGYADIHYIAMGCYYSGTYWDVRYNATSDVFSESGDQEMKDRIELDTSGSSVVKVGNTMDITWLIKIEWVHPEMTNAYIAQAVYDLSGLNDVDFYGGTHDYKTRLDWSSVPAVTDDDAGTVDRGGLNEAFTMQGTLKYYGSALVPPDAEVDVWVSASEYGTNEGPWSDTLGSSGLYSVTCYADNLVGQDTYTMKPVANGGLSSGDSLYWDTSDLTDTYIADALTITITGPTDNRQNLNANATGITMSAVYDFGGVFDGTLTLNNTDYNGDGTVVRWGYTVSSASGDTHGVTAISTNDETYMIWDQIEVYYGAVSDGRTNVDESENPQFRLRLKYDLHLLNDYSDEVWINGSVAGWSVGILAWYKSYDQSSVGSWNFLVTAASEDTYNITALNSASAVTYDQDIIWDRIKIITTATTDGRIDYGTTTTINVTAYLEYTTDGTHWLGSSDTLYMNGTSMTWDTDHFYLITGAYNIVDIINYFVNSSSANEATYGITVVNLDSNSADVIWDRIIILTTTVDDGRIDISTAAAIAVTAQLEYDSHALGAGDALYMNNTAMSWNGTHFTLTPNFAVVDLWSFFVNSSSANEATYGITVINLDGNSVNVIWDRVEVYSITRSHPHYGLDANGAFYYYLRYDYNNEAFGDLVGYTFTSDTGSHVLTQHVSNFYYFTMSSYSHSTVTKDTMSTLGSCDETTYGLTTWTSTADSIYIIWDYVEVTDIAVSDSYLDTGSVIWLQCQFRFASRAYWADYDYVTGWSVGAPQIEAPYTTGYTPSLSGDEGSGWFRTSVNFAPNNPGGPQNYVFNTSTMITAGVGATGMANTVFEINEHAQSVTWDQLICTITVGDNRININVNATIGMSATYQIGGGTYDGTLVLNYTTYNHTTAQRQGYTIDSAAGDDTHGITTIGTNDEDYVIWDSLTITADDPDDQRIDINVNMTAMGFTAIRDYDSSVFDGSLNLNDTTYDYGTVGRYGYTVSSASGGTYDITYINVNDDTYCIFDRIKILTTMTDDNRISYDTQAIITTTAELEFDSHALGSGDTLYMNGTLMSWNGSHFVLNPQFAVVGNWSFYVNSTSANEDDYGITVINLDGNSVNQIWDRVIWQTYTRNATVEGTPGDERQTNCTSVNIGETVNITARFLFEHDSTAVTSGTILLEGESMSHIANGYWYLEVSNETAQHGVHYQWNSFVTTGNTYAITVENTNSKDFYIIWDLIYIDAHGVEPDARHNLGEYPTLWVTAKLTYDDDVLDTTSDYIKLAGQTFQWNGSYLVNNTFTLHQVGQFTLYTNDTGHNENTYGITEIEYYSFTTIFDRVFVYAMWSPTEADNRTNYGDTETVYVSFVSEHDNSSMTAGTFELNSTGMSYVSGSIWQKTGYSYSAVVNYTFNVNSASWSAYGINQINYNGWNVTYYYIVWDRVKILTTVTDDGRIDYDTNATLSVTAELEYDSHSLGSGDTLYLNNTAMSWNGSHFVLLDQDFTVIGIWNYYVNTSGVSEADYGITYLNLDGNSVDQIWDRVYLTGIFVSDSRASYGTDVNVTVTAKSEYSDATLGSGDSIYINGTLATWDSTHSVFNVTYSYDEVVNKTFHVTTVTEATYGITALTNDTHVWIIWDRLKITDFAVDNVIPDPLQMIFINLTMVYEFDDAEFHFDNGTITMIAYNVTWDVEEEKNMHWNDTNWQFNHTMPAGVGVIRNFNISAYLDSVYGIVVINWNGFDNVTAGSDRVIVVSYTVSDNRDDINDYIWLNVTLQLESNGTAIIDGDVVVNGYIFTHISGGNWRYNTTQASVTSIDFDSVVAENNTYGIETVNQNGQYTTIIWDRIVITNFWVIDNRTDVDTVVQIRLTAELDFDDTALGSGDTIYINSTLATWDAVNLRFYISENYGSALNYTYGLTSITATCYGITEVTNTSYIWQIWDQFVLTRFDSSDADGRTNLDETEYIHFGMKWDFDDEVFQSGNGTIYLNSTLMIWNASQTCWTFSWVESAPVSYQFAYASHTDSVHGITAIDWGAYDNVTQTWDRIGVVVITNMTWTVVGYDVMISYTSTYESDGITWDGNATVANTSMVATSRPRNENLTFTTVTNKTFYATVISADPNGVTGFTTTTVWCVWDNMTANAMYGADVTEYSKTFIVLFGELSWQHNSSGIGVDWVCLNIRNGTSLNWATSLADNYLEPLKQELPIPLAWDVILYSNNATKTIGGRYYNFQWFSVEQTVVLGQSVRVEGNEILDVTIVVSGTTNVDFTWTIYNELIETGETGSVSGVNNWEISFSRNVTYGLYNFSIHFDASLSGNRWYNSSYFNDFVLSIEIPEQVDDYMEIKGTSSLDCEWYVYNRDILSWTGESDTITGGNDYFQFLFLMQTASGKHNYSLYFNVSVVVFIWHNGSYYIAPAVFDVDIEDLVFHDDFVEVIGISKLATAWYVYNEGIYSGESGSETAEIGFTFSFVKNTSVGKHNFSVYFNDTIDGSNYRWYNRSYTISAVYADCSVVLYGPDGIGIDLILFKIYVNDVEYAGSSITFYGRTDATHNITILNYFDEVVGTDNNAMPDDRVIHVEVSVYAFKIYNQMDDEFIYFNMTSSGGAIWSEHIAPREVVKFYLYGGNTYTYAFTALRGPYPGTHIGTVSVSEDTGMIIDGFDLVQIYDGIGRIGGSGIVSIADMAVALNAAQGSILNQVQFFSWLGVIMLFAGLYVIPFVKNKGRVRAPKDVPEFSETYGGEAEISTTKKRSVPKQLEKHAFKKGLMNPKFGGGLEDMSDQIWGKLRSKRKKRG